MSLPTGIVTFLFTDIEGSTRLWEVYGASMAAALARHDGIVRAAIAAHGGEVFKHTGDGMCVVFAAAPDAVAAALDAQRALRRESWNDIGALRVRMALHTGTAEIRGEDYYGPTLNRCARLLAAAHGGQVLLTRTTAELTREGLPGDGALQALGTHRLRDIEQPERIFQLTHPELPATFPPLRAADQRRSQLPVQLTSFVGRGQELTALLELLNTSRLVTLTGVGGCGKTRLALQAAAREVSEFDGVYVAELAAVTDPALVAKEVAGLFGIADTTSGAAAHSLEERLVDSLAGRHLLLVLDNCEHLLSACAALVETLLTCPELTILATSREALGCAGERVWQVPSLNVNDAVELFVDRATTSTPGFALASDDADAVSELCRRLDGIPLAIELAAARVRHLPPQQLLARLNDRFRVLTGGRRTALPRQQTLQATMDWSHELLSEPERVFFRRLSVFAGGFSVEAAEAICAGGAVGAAEVLDLLGHLVDKSLVAVNAGRTVARYRLLETVRQYAAQKLAESAETGDVTAVRRRHRDWYLALARQAAPRFFREMRVWLPRLRVEHDNLRAALEWSLDAGDAETLLRLCAALHGFWVSDGHMSEGGRWAEVALALGTDAPPPLRAAGLDVAGDRAQLQGDYDRALAFHEQALAIWRQVGSKGGAAWSLFWIGRVHYFRGDDARCVPATREALALHLEVGDLVGAAWSAVCHAGSGYPLNAAAIEESICLARAAGHEALEGFFTVNLGANAALSGDTERALALCEDGLAMIEAVGERFVFHWALPTAAGVAFAAGDHALARERLARGVALARETGAFEALPGALETTAALRATQGRLAAAARLWGAAEAVRSQVGVAVTMHPFRGIEAPHRDAARAALGQQAFDAAFVAGRAMSVRETIAWALRELGGEPGSA